MKVWIVQGIWHHRSDISWGDANTTIAKVLKHEPTTAEAQEILDEFVHDPENCAENRKDDPTFQCHRCWRAEVVVASGEGLDDKDEFSQDDHGWILEVVEAELED